MVFLSSACRHFRWVEEFTSVQKVVKRRQRLRYTEPHRHRAVAAVAVWVRTVRSNLIVRAVAQTNVGRIERLTERIREFEYEGKNREELAHARDELPGSKVAKKRVQGQKWRARGLGGTRFSQRKTAWKCGDCIVENRISAWSVIDCFTYDWESDLRIHWPDLVRRIKSML